MEPAYAVTWHEAARPAYAGRLELGSSFFRFDGSGPRGRLLSQLVFFRDLVAVRIGRGPEDRIAGRPALVIERRSGPPVHVATLGEPGTLHELDGKIHELAPSLRSGE